MAQIVDKIADVCDEWSEFDTKVIMKAARAVSDKAAVGSILVPEKEFRKSLQELYDEVLEFTRKSGYDVDCGKVVVSV
jgi:hypothetical protein